MYAEGTIESASTQAITLPESALLRAGDKSSVWRLKADVLNLVDLGLGARDPRTGDYEVRSGLAEGDLILRNPSASFKEGQRINRVAVKPPAGAASSAVVAQGT